jgi:cytochrome c553
MKTTAWVIVVFAAALPQAARPQSAQPAPAQPPAVAQQCAACHGASGEGNPGQGFPRIAGQSQYYLAKQLESYANGTRQNPIMGPIAKSLSRDDRLAAAGFYSQMDTPAAAPAPGGAAQPLLERGRVLATTGDNDRRVAACANCHGPGGAGEPPAYPYLAGLDSGYLTAALKAWKNGTRKNDGGQQMGSIANALSEADIDAAAQFYANLPPPKPVPVTLVQATAPVGKPAATPSAVQPAGARPDRSVGTEQGGPTSGGTQGPGGSGESKADKSAGTKAR